MEILISKKEIHADDDLLQEFYEKNSDAACRIIATNIVKQLNKNGLIPHLTCHCFRHTFAVILCERNVNVKVAQMLLGHKDISTTMDIYMRVSERFAFEEYAKKVEELDYATVR